ncbi:uncharacterized protein LOC131157427 [Malania oleifera]|uniref:uncharacterized protein LOC131157427 n=1 Tax=Malania oleifera TaxID=397392 RepID=UPI0025AE3D79|nr:uncharacterized protein LOC131157427 [Malania oleifera]XP_057967558.1 uncharacterized protein LOC131157427 [Malania oleifera]XP_057967559.1 uncharacterized protein LOC131157427 [Malania oleifera]XP_057967560.1 uncharacterized protein LOC131157427 [Malania oleifera]XP_057967562.1 uncharacterized protein LOC131157427 [Malania oleifera]XP_057967563.1 uncharacterized protein LOC131157427 [Malania oleifera]XP_057967564.1 uncharacterized protein LOC131157427 [Malania oleifera]XP_057967565.1 unc
MDASEVSVNVHDHGKPLDERKKKVQCNYCAKVVSGFSRLKYHIGGIRGDVTPCEQVPPNVRQLMRNELLDKKKGMLGKEVGELQHPNLPLKRNWCESSNGIKSAKLENNHISLSGRKKLEDCVSEYSVRDTVPNGKTGPQATTNSREGKDSSSMLVQKCIGRFFFETGMDYSAINSPSFRRMLNATLSHHQVGFQIPSCQELKGWILQDEVKEMQQYVEDIKQSWTATGCSILLDGWTDEKGRNLINFLVDCSRGTIYLHSTDISDFIEDVDALCLLFDGIIEEVGVENVIQIISYTTSDCMVAVGKKLMEKHGTVFWTVSASHCIELMLDKIKMKDSIRGILDKAKIITRFIYNHATVLKLLRNHTNGRDIFKPSKIKSTLPFLTLENIVTERENLKKMFSSSDWKTSIWASRSEGKRVADLVVDRSFWTGARSVLKAAIPLVRVLCLLDEDSKEKMGYIYETLDQAKETISEEFNDRKSQYLPYWELIDGIWNPVLHSPLHSAGYFLNPSLKYSSDFFFDSEVGSGLLCCVVRMIQDCHTQDLISNQIDKYRRGEGVFCVGGEAMESRDQYPPALWWSYYGGQCPELQRLAFRILSQTCDGASRYRLKRSLAEKLLAKGRNLIEEQQLRDLTYVHYNLQLQHFNSGLNCDIDDEEIDSMDDWIANEVEGTDFQNGDSAWIDLDCGGTTISGGIINGEGTSSFHPKEEPG